MDNNVRLNTTIVPKELLVILDMLKAKDLKSTMLIEEGYSDIDWRYFMKLVMHHRLFSPLYIKLKNLEHDLIPIDTVNTLSNYFKWNTLQMLNLSSEMLRMSTLFLENNISALFLKGPILGQELYGDVSLRTSGDLDILIPISKVHQVENMLRELGYIKDDYILTILGDWKWRHHHMTFYHPQKKVKLEIHWRLNPGPAKEPSFLDLWKRKNKIRYSEQSVYILGKEDLFYFLVTHGARHGWSRLRWLLDIHQLIIKHELDWPLLIELVEKYQSKDVVGQALILGHELLNTPLSDELVTLFFGRKSMKLAEEALFYLENMINLHSIPVPDNVSKYHKRHLYHIMSTKQKLLFLVSLLYPYPEDAETLPLPQFLHFLYFPLRPLLWIWRKTLKHSLLGGYTR